MRSDICFQSDMDVVVVVALSVHDFFVHLLSFSFDCVDPLLWLLSPEFAVGCFWLFFTF